MYLFPVFRVQVGDLCVPLLRLSLLQLELVQQVMASKTPVLGETETNNQEDDKHRKQKKGKTAKLDEVGSHGCIASMDI
jgi:hypothetical protein